MKTVFLGTPAIAVPFLRDLAASQQVLAVVSQPDKPSGRKLEVQPTPVKAAALELGLKVYQPAKPSELIGELQALEPELFVTCAYGRILKPELLAVPKLGCLNVHFSLLPKYRGAAPIQWALYHGEAETGVSVFWLDPGMDTGPLLLTRPLKIDPDEDAAALGERLVELGRGALKESLELIAQGKAPKVPQAGEPSLAPMLEKEHGRLDFELEAAQFHNRVRALRTWPRAYLDLGGKKLQVLRTRVEPAEAGPARPGTIIKIESGKGFLLKCRVGAVWVLEVQPEGRGPMPGASFLNGSRLGAGDRLI